MPLMTKEIIETYFEASIEKAPHFAKARSEFGKRRMLLK